MDDPKQTIDPIPAPADSHTTDLVLFCKDDESRPAHIRWCGVVVQAGSADGEVIDVTFRPTHDELMIWFDGWQAGWKSRKFHEARSSIIGREAVHAN